MIKLNGFKYYFGLVQSQMPFMGGEGGQFSASWEAVSVGGVRRHKGGKWWCFCLCFCSLLWWQNWEQPSAVLADVVLWLRLILLYYKAYFQCVSFFLFGGGGGIKTFLLKQYLLWHLVKIGESFKNDDTLNKLAVTFVFKTYFFNTFGLIFNSWKAWPRNLICFVWLGLLRIRMSGYILAGNRSIKDLFWCVKIIVYNLNG